METWGLCKELVGVTNGKSYFTQNWTLKIVLFSVWGGCINKGGRENYRKQNMLFFPLLFSYKEALHAFFWIGFLYLVFWSFPRVPGYFLPCPIYHFFYWSWSTLTSLLSYRHLMLLFIFITLRIYIYICVCGGGLNAVV